VQLDSPQILVLSDLKNIENVVRVGHRDNGNLKNGCHLETVPKTRQISEDGS
jgi:hypothetical protein